MDKFQKAALATANRARAALGLPPVSRLYKGEPGAAARCAITNTIYDDDLERDEFAVETNYQGITNPEPGIGYVSIHRNSTQVFAEEPNHDTQIFLEKFDNEEYPDLISDI